MYDSVDMSNMTDFWMAIKLNNKLFVSWSKRNINPFLNVALQKCQQFL